MAKKIMLIDDEPDTLTLLSTRLTASGFDVVPALDPIQGLKKIKETTPDLIILDVLMPKMTGYDFVQEVKKCGAEVKNIPIIVISARRSMKDFFNRWDIHSFIPKPFNSDELITAVNNALKIPVPGSAAEEAAGMTGDASSGAASDAPAKRASGEKYRILVVGIEDYLVEKLKTHLGKQGYEADSTSDEEYAFRQAKQWKPAYIYCQYWEDPNTLDAKTLYQKLKGSPETNGIKFAAFCPATMAVEALKLLEPGQVLPYSKGDELLAKVIAHLQANPV
ncbi:MAG TPA: response regulator [Verrucomicrobiae bacterium]|jgi:DNA-binding response OmpR family regulator|nr:response regulator [Verrucomicrobiae bacterium]